ncbi:hypothetical protein LIA77_01326 [Sarocladium implicatum]|nr:hypothetical protein LIA77_01326 [Sarocladium implicatum]
MVPINPKMKPFNRSYDHTSSQGQQLNSASQRSSLLPQTATPQLQPRLSVKPRPDAELTTVLIGQHQQRFKVNKKLLCAASPFFRDRLEDQPHNRPISLWLPGENPTMFALFVEWLHARERFRTYLDETIIVAQDEGEDASQDIHWAIIRLHLFASSLGLHHLQDLAMDALQDLYLRCDWDVPPGFIEHLYTKCEALPAVRLRRWAVAMVAFSLTGAAGSAGASQFKFHPQGAETSDPARFQDLLDRYPEFAMDYAVHLRKMKSSGLDVRFKNPQLRIPANKLRNEERAFGFRECSFHSHRATVGERRCPHSVARTKSLGSMSGKIVPAPAPVTISPGKPITPLSAPPPTSSSSKRDTQDPVPRPLFSRDGDDKGERQRAVMHIRAKSSVAR